MMYKYQKEQNKAMLRIGQIGMVLIILTLIICTGIKIHCGYQYQSDIGLMNFHETDNAVEIKIMNMSSAGFVRDIEIHEHDAVLTCKFLSTFGINEPWGAKSKFTVPVNENIKIIKFSDRDVLIRDDSASPWHRP